MSAAPAAAKRRWLERLAPLHLHPVAAEWLAEQVPGVTPVIGSLRERIKQSDRQPVEAGAR